MYTVLDKFEKYYKVAKSKSISYLTSYFYNLNHDLDLTVNLRSSSMICIQVDSVKWHKTEGLECK